MCLSGVSAPFRTCLSVSATLHTYSMWSICTDVCSTVQNNLSPVSLTTNTEWLGTTQKKKKKIIYLAPLLLSGMVFVESEETICCPVIMGGQGGGDWKWREQIKLRENGRRCPRTRGTFLPTCSKSVVLINIPSDISWHVGVCACVWVHLLCVCVCVCVCPQCVRACSCVCVSYLTLIIFKSGLFLSRADMLSM